MKIYESFPFLCLYCAVPFNTLHVKYTHSFKASSLMLSTLVYVADPVCSLTNLICEHMFLSSSTGSKWRATSGPTQHTPHGTSWRHFNNWQAEPEGPSVPMITVHQKLIGRKNACLKSPETLFTAIWVESKHSSDFLKWNGVKKHRKVGADEILGHLTHDFNWPELDNGGKNLRGLRQIP